MKKSIFVLFSITLIAFTAMLSCKKENKNFQSFSNTKGSNLNQYLKLNGYDIGELHNQAMVAGIDTSQFDFTSDANFLNSVSTFVNDFLLANEPDLANSSICNEYASFISPPVLISEVDNLSTHWNGLYNSGNMSESELQLLNNIKALIVANLNDNISNVEFQTEMATLASANSGTTSTLAKSVFEITFSSCQYWIDDENLDPQAAVHWAALDAAGALVGGTIAHIRGGDIVEGALIGAVSGSLRLVGTIAKGISRWLGI